MITKLNSCYKPLALIFVLFMFLALLNIPIINSIWRHSFDDGTYSHAFLIPFICAFLYYQLAINRRLEFRNTINPIAVFIFLFSCFLVFLTVKLQISIAFWLAYLLLFICAINLFIKYSHALLFASCYFIFLIPMWGFVSDVLQELSIAMVTLLLQYTNIPIYVNDQYISIPAGTFEIADGCSGLRYIMVSLAISSLYISLYIHKLKPALLFISLAIVGALITNWLRITSLIMIGQYTNMTSDLIENHNNFGWYIYIPFLFLLFWAGNKLSTESTGNDNNAQPLSDEKYTTQISTQRLKIYANKYLICILIFGVILSSSTLIRAQKLPTSTLISPEPLLPHIEFYSDFELLRQPVKNGHLLSAKYYFDCADLGCKPTYYLNDLLPKGWQKSSHVTATEYQQFRVNSRSNTGVIQFSYQINDLQINSSSALKRAQLMKFYQNNSIILNWTMLVCEPTKTPIVKISQPLSSSTECQNE